MSDTSDLLISGYIHQHEKLLFDNPLNTIPSCIIKIFHQFYQFSRFEGLNCGTYTWNITNKQTVEQILNASHQQKFESSPFIMAKLKWIIEIHPNGHKDFMQYKGNIVVIVRLLSFPSNIDEITLSRMITCNKAMTSNSFISTLNDKKTVSRWWEGCTLQDWKSMNLDDISITVNVKINRMRLNKLSDNLKLSQPKYDENTFLGKVTYNHLIDKKEMDRIRKFYATKAYESEIFDGLWRLEMFPYGIGTDMIGYCSIFLNLCILPPYVNKIKAKYKIICNETNDVVSDTDDFSLDAQGWGAAEFMESTKINSYQTLSFAVIVEVLSVEFEEDADKLSRTIYDPEEIHQILSIK